MVAIVLSIKRLEFNIGSYQFNAFTYPAWSSIILQLISLVSNLIFVRMIEKEKAEEGSVPLPPAGRAVYMSTGVALIFAVFFFDGFFLACVVYALPLVLQDGYGWTIIQYSPVWVGISFVGIAGVQIAKKSGQVLRSQHYLVIVPTLGYMCVMALFMAVGSVGLGRLPRGLGEAFFLFGAETGFGAFQVMQTTLSSIFSQLIPPQYIVGDTLSI